MNEMNNMVFKVQIALCGIAMIFGAINTVLEEKNRCTSPNCQNQAEYDDGKCYLHTKHRVDDDYLFGDDSSSESEDDGQTDYSSDNDNSSTYKSSGSGSTYGKHSGSGSRGSSNSEMYDYDNADDYAGDYAEDYAIDEFGDCDSEEAYEYGYDEAYDDWEDEMEE